LWFAANLAAFPELFLLPAPDPELAQLGMTRSVELVTGAAGSVILLAFALPFLWLTVWRGRNWARWALFLGFAASIPFAFIDALDFDPHQLLLSGSPFVSTALEAAAFFFLFTGDAPPWFKRENAKIAKVSAPRNG
jgi:hypothetical protein